jgi:hypothetical protein
MRALPKIGEAHSNRALLETNRHPLVLQGRFVPSSNPKPEIMRAGWLASEVYEVLNLSPIHRRIARIDRERVHCLETDKGSFARRPFFKDTNWQLEPRPRPSNTVIGTLKPYRDQFFGSPTLEPTQKHFFVRNPSKKRPGSLRDTHRSFSLVVYVLQTALGQPALPIRTTHWL